MILRYAVYIFCNDFKFRLMARLTMTISSLIFPRALDALLEVGGNVSFEIGSNHLRPTPESWILALPRKRLAYRALGSHSWAPFGNSDDHGHDASTFTVPSHDHSHDTANSY